MNKIKNFKIKLIKDAAARDPINFFGVPQKPSVSRKTKKIDKDRLLAIYEDVHNFTLLDPSVQVERLKDHLITVGGRRRVQSTHFDPLGETTYEDLSDISD